MPEAKLIDTDTAPPLLEMRGITKTFPGVQALTSVDFNVYPGEVHALVGENGAGKSTLMKILAGVYERDAGEILLKGKPVDFTNPRQAQLAGIVTIYQELNQVPEMSVTENIFLGSELERSKLLKWKEMHEKAKELLAKLHLDIDPRQPIKQLGVGQQQMVEVAKALHQQADLIIMDEPTSSLSIREINDLFAIVKELKEAGVAIVYISHHLEETFAIADRITVLRDGRHVATKPTGELNIDNLVRLMVGRDLSEKYPKEIVPRGEEILRVENLNRAGVLSDINFAVYAGEVLGIAGLVGAGRTELARAVFGADLIDGGKFYVRGQPVKIANPNDAIQHGIGLLTEDRKQQGLFLQMSVRDNIVMAVLKRLTRGLRTNRRREADVSRRYIESMNIKASSQEQLAINLSGGTQQKVVLGKWMSTEPRVLIFDEPTRGIDVGAKVEIYKMMNELARQGVAILMISSELPEILGMSDRVLVMRGGCIRGELTRAEATEEKIMEFATGTDKPSELSLFQG